MSKALQHFVDNFYKGASIGMSWMDYAQKAKDRKDANDIARERNKIAAQRYKDTAGINERRTAAYERDIAAKAAGQGYYNRAKGGGGGAGAGLSPQGQAFIGDMQQRGLNVAPPAPDRSAPTQQSDPEIPDSQPPEVVGGGDDTSDDGTSGTVPGAAQGGRIPKYAMGGRRQRGQQMMQSMMTAGINAAKKAQQPKPAATPAAQPTITRGPSTDLTPQPATGNPTPLQPSAGTNGPGSGYGDTAAPPVTAQPMPQPTQGIDTSVPDMSGAGAGMGDMSGGMDAGMGGSYRRGGRVGPRGPRVRGFAGGGSVDKAWREKRDAMIARAAKPDDTNIDRSLREQNDYLSPPGAPTGREQAFRRGGTVRGYADGGTVNTAGTQYTDDDRDAAYDWAETSPGRVGGARSDRFPRDPGETGGQPDMPNYVNRDKPPSDSPDEHYQDDPRTKGGGQLPGVTVTAKRDGGGRRGIATDHPWKALTDQTRDEAYDPVKDALDPDNIAAVDREGRTQPHVGQRVIMDAQGNTQRIENPVPGGHMETGGNDYMSGAVKVASQVGAQHPQQVYNGSDVTDHKTMNDLMRSIDPQGSMTPQQRMEAAIKATHEWYLQQGQPEQADKAAYDVAQYGVQQSRPFGVQAAKQAQAGDLQGAARTLTQGYQHLPDQQHAVVQGNQIIILDKDGKATRSLPITQQTIMNLSLGMATGKLGWDVMGYNPPQPAPPPQAVQPQAPGAMRPAAQPSAAPAGPAPQPPAAPNAQATGQASATQAPAGQPNMEPAASALAPVHPGGQQGIQPTAPQPPAQPQQPPPQGAPQPPPTGTPPPPAARTAPPAQKPQGTGPAPSDEEQFFRKNPNGIYTATDRLTAEGDQTPRMRDLDQRKQARVQQYVQDRQFVQQRAAQLGVPAKERTQLVNLALANLKTGYDADMKDIGERQKTLQANQMEQEKHDREVESKPRNMPSSGELSQLQSDIDKRIEALSGAAHGENSVMHNLPNDDDKQRVKDLALNIWQQNTGMTGAQAADAAVALTKTPPKGMVGFNYGKDKDARMYRAHHNPRQGLSLNMQSGNRVLVDRNTFNEIDALTKRNYDGAEKARKHAADQAKLSPVTRSLQAIGDLIPPSPARAAGAITHRLTHPNE
jgi:hypothetical protein